MSDTPEPEDGITLSDFPGLVNTADPRDLPPGAAQEQWNLVSRIAGETSVRRGWREVTFESVVVV